MLNFRVTALALIILLGHYTNGGTTISQVNGCVGFYENNKWISKKVLLDAFKDSGLKNEYVEIINPPKNIDNLCFQTNDKRFAFVHSYYYATEILKHYFSVITKLGMKTKGPVKIKIDFDYEYPTTGERVDDIIKMQLSQPLYDPMILAHELGHALHVIISEVYPSDRNVREGTANFLAAFYFNDPRVGDRYMDDGSAISIDTFIASPNNIVTYKKRFEMSASSKASVKFPKLKTAFEDKLKDPKMTMLLNEPDPYYYSAMINQPLWQAAQKWGTEKIVHLYINAISNPDSGLGILPLAWELVDLSKDTPDLQKFLKLEFRKRGITMK